MSAAIAFNLGQRLLDAIALSVLATDLEDRIFYWGRGAQELYGYAAAEVLGKHVNVIVDEKELTKQRQRFAYAIEHGLWQGQYLQRHRDGSRFWRDTSISLVRDQVGAPEGLIYVDRDITARLKTEYEKSFMAEQRAQVSDALLRNVINSLTAHIAVVSDEGEILAANDAWRRFSEKHGNSVLVNAGVNYLDVCRRAAAGADDSAARALEGIRTVLDGSAAQFVMEYPCHSPGVQRWFLLHATPLDRPGGAVLAHVDITERKQAVDALRKSELRYRSLFDNTLDAILLADDTGRYLDANKAACALLGYPQQQVTELNVSDITPATNQEQGARLWKEFIALGELTGEYTVRRKDGELREVEFRAVANVLPGVHLSDLRDVTERKRAERQLIRLNKDLEKRVAERTQSLDALVEDLRAEIEHRKSVERALRDSEGRFRDLANAAPIMVWMSAPNKVCTYFNQRWLDYTGRSLNQELGDGWMESLHPEDRSACLVLREAALESRESFEMEYRLRRRDGEHRWIHDRGVPRYQYDGTFAGFVGAAMDVDGRKKAEQRLLVLQEELAHSQRVTGMGQMAHVLAHEINQPLAAMTTFAQGAAYRVRRRDIDAGELADVLDHIAELAKTAGKITSRIKAFVAKTAPRKLILDLNDVVEDVASLSRNDAAQRSTKIELQLEIAAVCVAGDRVQLQQVLLNLVRNGIDAMVHLPRQQRLIRVTTKVTDEGVCISVSDCGKGVPEDEMPRLFQPYYTTKSDGLGVGLSISQTIVSNHGGRIVARRNPETGMTFEVWLPVIEELTEK